MLSTTLAQLRLHAGRLLASCLAVVIAVGFVVATLALGASTRASVLDAVGAPYRVADVVVDPTEAAAEQGLSDLDGFAERAAALPGAAAVAADASTYLEVSTQGRPGRRLALVASVSPEGPLRWERLASGRLPVTVGEVAVSERSGLAVGDALSLHRVDGTGVPQRVVGVVDLGADPTAGTGERVLAPLDAVLGWSGEVDQVRLAAAADPGALLASATAALGGEDVRVRNGEAAAEGAAAGYTGEAAGITTVLLAFAAVAVLVAGMVIANTFALVLAQRTRELALLRCVGATRAQVRRGVLGEAAAVGLGASVVGVVGGLGVAAAVSVLVGRTDAPIPLGAVVVPPAAIATGLVVGLGVTLLAASAPARAATRVAPLAALRPLDPAPLRSRPGLLRALLGLALLLPGLAGLGVTALAGELLPAVACGAATFVGLLLLAQRAVPPVVALAGRALGRLGGVPGRLAAVNALRNPRRTAAVATALLIGVTLTTTMVVGASSTRATTSAALDAGFPADVVVDAADVLPDGLAERLAGLEGVTGVAVLSRALVGTPQGEMEVTAVDPAAAARALRSQARLPLPAPGTVVVGEFAGVAPGTAELVLSGPAGERALRVVEAADTSTPLLMTSADLAALDPAAAERGLWLRLVDGLDDGASADVVDEVTDLVAEQVPGSLVVGAAAERAALDDVVRTMLLVVTGLLGVAVVIALLGVGNTLALSVVERRQESGLLRALGLTRRQLQAVLVLEALLVSAVAAALGVLLGTGYGLAGTAAALARESDVVLDVPWLQVAGTVVAATLAGLLASVLPARRAGRTSPVQALA